MVVIKSPFTGKSKIEYPEYMSDLEGILKSVPSPFQVRFKSVPYIGDIKVHKYS